RAPATPPPLRRGRELRAGGGGRHGGCGPLCGAGGRKQQRKGRRVASPRHWLGQILGSIMDKPGPIFLSRVVRRLRDAGVANADGLAAAMLAEQREINARELADATSGAHVPHLLKNARRAGLLAPDILEALGLEAQ